MPGADCISGLWISIYVQYADTGFLGTFQGKQWQKDYLVGKANVSDTPGMMDCMEYI